MTSALKAGDNIGIMDPAFFVSKNEILGWINSFFQVGKACSLISDVAERTKSRAVRDRSFILSDIGRGASGVSANEQGELAGQA